VVGFQMNLPAYLPVQLLSQHVLGQSGLSLQAGFEHSVFGHCFLAAFLCPDEKATPERSIKAMTPENIFFIIKVLFKEYYLLFRQKQIWEDANSRPYSRAQYFHS